MIDIFPAGADMLVVHHALDEPFSIFWLIATRQVTEKIKEIHHLVECVNENNTVLATETLRQYSGVPNCRVHTPILSAMIFPTTRCSLGTTRLLIFLSFK